MADGIRARDLLRQAAADLDAHPELLTLARRAGAGGFDAGAEWMRSALAVLRGGRTPRGRAPFRRAGWIKYGACVAIALSAGFGAASLHVALAIPALVLAFYATEARTVFLFPLLLDGGRRGGRLSRQATRRAGGTLVVMATVAPLAATMIFGGFLGRGFVRSWTLGCLAVLVWYERTRSRPRVRARLDVLATAPLLMRREDGGGRSGRRILFASDLHLGAPCAARAAAHLLARATHEAPDAILLGGDLVDRRAGLQHVGPLVARLAAVAPVLAVPGNHDVAVGVAAVRDAVVDGGGRWLLDGATRLGTALVIDGAVTPRDGEAGYRVLVAHDPGVLPAAARADYDLVLAGHLHGGQVVLWEGPLRLYPGALVYRWNGLRFTRDRTTMLVSRGVADTVPLRWRCPRDVLVVTV